MRNLVLAFTVTLFVQQISFAQQIAITAYRSANQVTPKSLLAADSDGTAAKKLWQVCKSSVFGAAACGMATLAAASAVQNLFGSDEAAKSANALACADGTCGQRSNTTVTDPTSPGYRSDSARSGSIGTFGLTAAQRAAIQSTANQVLKDTKGKGFSFNPKTGQLTTPKGSIDARLMGTPEGMKAAGFSPQEIAAAQQGLAAAANEAEKAVAALDAQAAKSGDVAEEGGGGGRAGMYRGSVGKDDDSMAAYLASLQGGRKPASKESLQGLSVMIKGEPVGIAGGNIFETINSRYTKLREQGVVGDAVP